MRVVASSRFIPRARKLKPPRGELLRAALADYWAFSVDDDLRVLFRWEGDICFLVNLGSHEELY